MATLYTIEEVNNLLNEGKKLLLAGDEKLLAKVQQGNWIGGTIPYFMSEEVGGVFETTKLYVNIIPEEVDAFTVKAYDETTIESVGDETYINGFSFILIPAFSKMHLYFANNAMGFSGIYNTPLLGWITGVSLDDIGKVNPKVFNGLTGEASDSSAMVMHCSLPDLKNAHLDIINLFKPGTGDTITFPETGFSATTCLVNGEEWNFAEYLTKKNINLQLPLVADYYGAFVNTSFQSIDETNKQVNFYAPVFPNVEYKIAQPITDYSAEFEKVMKEETFLPFFTCNCILNYLYGNLEGKKTGALTGPITFGEIAYTLLNQTLVYLLIE
ncbi:MAG: hypothetical protein LWX56_03385 [Ignavibacteria bacterium]|nr:hypothetical protein [Ignavibacteria bacterium]